MRQLTCSVDLGRISTAGAPRINPKGRGTEWVNHYSDNTAGTNNAPNSNKFAVQDGLLFNAVREGEKVAFTVQEINGVKTIIKLEKE